MLNTQLTENCYCAFCKMPRRYYAKKGVGLVNVVACFLGASILTFLIYRGFEPVGLAYFGSLLVVTEIFLKIRWRIAMTCRHCGFDPVLYLKNVNAAVDKVKRKLDQRKADPATVLAQPLRLPKAKRPPPSQGAGQILSKQV